MKLKTILLTAIGLSLFTTAMHATGEIKQVPFTNVQITDQFWKQRLDVMRNTTIRYAFQKCDEAGLIRNFEYAGKIVSGEAKVGDYTFQSLNPYDDGDLYKTLEGASYLLKVQPDAELEAYCDEIIDKIVSAQEPDGYIQTNFTIHNPLHSWYNGEKWTSDWNLSHETFNVAELVECAIAYYQATGKDKLLNCAIKAADNLLSVFNEDGIKMAPGHAVIEMALVRLYELTGEEKYLNECKFFLDCRGIRQFDPTSDDQRVNGKYWQDHLPAIQQRTAEGHAVRAMYFYSGMSDWVRYSGDQDYETAVTAIWNNIASKKFYITGGFGARDNNEAFGENYELPNATAYCETCASVAGSMFNLRMFRLHGESKYIDMLERALYNTVLDGYSIKGKSFYYTNRLEASTRGNERSEWFGTSCCPTNVARLIPAVPGYVYATDFDGLYVNLFVDSKADVTVGSSEFDVTQSTAYPYDGKVKIALSNYKDLGSNNGELKYIKVRIPGWAQNKPVDSDLYSYVNPTTTPVTISVDGKECTYETENGYAIIPVTDINNMTIEVSFPMDVHQVVSNDSLTTNEGLRSYERGPIVYCAEGIDNENSLDNIYIPENTTYTTTTGMQDTFDGDMPEIIARGMKKEVDNDEQKLVETDVTLIPYFARAYREGCRMKVWIPMDESGTETPVEYIDQIQPCDDANEKAHNLEGSNMRTGSDLGWRDSDGGYIQYTLKVNPERPNDLIVKYWGSDSGNRKFDIIVNGTKVAYEEVENFAPNQYYYMHYAIPFELSKGKESVTVKFQSIDGSTIGGLFGIYTAISEEVPSQTVPIDYMWTYGTRYIKNHSYTSNGESGTFRNHTWRDGKGEEGQSWKMDVNPTNRNYLMLYYWGSEYDLRDFDIYCDDVFVANQQLQYNNPGRFFFVCYPIPEEATSGKTNVTIHLTSPKGTKTGGIYYAYMMSMPMDDTAINTIADGTNTDERAFTIAGIPATEASRGIVIQSGKKTLK